MSGIDDQHSWPEGSHMREAEHYGHWHAVRQFLFGCIGLTAITFVAVRFHLQPGALSLLYLIVIVFVSLGQALLLQSPFP
jgi:hypothetical protein